MALKTMVRSKKKGISARAERAKRRKKKARELQKANRRR